MKYGFPNLFSLTVKVTSSVLCLSRDSLSTQLFGEECAIVSTVDFYFICKLCVLHATECWEATHPGLLVDTQNMSLQIVWLTVDYWTAIQMCVDLTVGMSTEEDYLSCCWGQSPREWRRERGSDSAQQFQTALQRKLILVLKSYSFQWRLNSFS